MIKVAIVGSGTVSQHLSMVLSKTNLIEVTQMLSSRGKGLIEAVRNEDDKTEQPDIYIIAVSDDAIKGVSKQLENSKKLIVHTSGSVAMKDLPEATRRGVFYPLQTFSKEREVDFSTIPICIEAEKEADLKMLKELAETVSEVVHEISSEQRKSLHLAAVFVNNFTNQLYQIGSKICQENDVPFVILKPLIQETVAKLNDLSPIEAQTGPAKRNDTATITAQLNQLTNSMDKEVYKILTKSIQQTNTKST